MARIALVRGALRGEDIAEQAPDTLLLGSPREDRERRRIRHGEHVGLLDGVEAGDRGAVEAHAALERVAELVAVDRERLQLTEDVGEPEPDEADVALGDDRLDVVGRLGAVVAHRLEPRWLIANWRACGGRSGRMPRAAGLSGQPAPRPALELVYRGSQFLAHLGQLVLDAEGPAGPHRAHDDAVALELLHALRQQAVGELGHGLGDLTEAQRLAVDENADDRARPAATDQLDRLVVVRAAGGTPFARRDDGPLRRWRARSSARRRLRAILGGFHPAMRPAASGCPRRSRRPARHRRR